MIALDAVELQHLLDRDADRRPAPPDAHQERRPEAAADDLHAQRQRVPQQGFRRNIGFFHGRIIHAGRNSLTLST